jgi:hypothetical protein
MTQEDRPIDLGTAGGRRRRHSLGAAVLFGVLALVACTTPSADPETLTVTLAGGDGLGTVTSSPLGIDCGVACSAPFGYGTTVTLTATPVGGATFEGWSGDCSGTGACTVTMSEARTITATFAPPLVDPQTLTVTLAGGAGLGSVTSSPVGIDCGVTCSVQFSLDTTVTLTATPADGATFEGWSGDCSGTGTCTVTMSETRAVTATFAAPPAQGLACEEVDEGAAGPTLVCTLADDRVRVEVPWQGSAVLVQSLDLDGLGYLPAEDDFDPLSSWPLLHLAIVDAVTEQPVVSFDPVVEITVSYDGEDFDAANPTVGEGELGVGVWDEATRSWIVVGHGVYHEGFWLADPIGGGGLVLQGKPAELQPRFLMTGTPDAGKAVALVAAAPPSLPLVWGAMPPDPDRMFKEFDGPCGDVQIDGIDAVECVSTMVGLTVRVPFQENGTVRPLVIALPWNIESTFDYEGGGSVTPLQQSGPSLIRQLMNFLVVDADDPTRVLTEFDPPLDFDIRYASEDADPEVNEFLYVAYWDEYVEQFVTLGSGFTAQCVSEGEFGAGCLWGSPEEAQGVDEFDGAFFRSDDDGSGNGVARFKYGIWGDRMVGMMR